MGNTKMFRVRLNMPDRNVLLDCEFQYVQHDESHFYDNLYVAPSLSTFNDAGSESAIDPGTLISDDRDYSVTHKLSSEKEAAIGTLLLQACASEAGGLLVFQIPKADYYVAYADPWKSRVADCALISSTHSFLSPLGEVTGFTPSSFSAAEITEALNVSAGAIMSPLSMNEESCQQLEFEIGRRLAFPWLASKPSSARRVCVVLDGELNITASRGRWDAAVALGIKIVVLSSGSWWKDDKGPYAHLREGFIGIDMNIDSNLPQRIADAVRSYPDPIDGIFAISCGLLIPVAEAATQLGLWTSGVQPFTISTNKYLTRHLLDLKGQEYFRVQSLQELETRLASSDPVAFPVVCKPTRGRASEGVYRADDAAQLRHAVSGALASKNGADVLIEPYVEGPEVDCNLVLLHGRLLYSEVVDDFPCEADVAKDATNKLFAETEAVVPSRLPPDEQRAIVDYVFETVRLQGFDTGVFHCEARVRNSSMEYVLAEGSPIPELKWVENSHKTTKKPPSIFFHEANARVPGVASSFASILARGIDFWALQLLCAVGDWSRYEALAIPFSQDDHCDHVWLTNTMELVTYKGIEPLFPGIPTEKLDHKMVDTSRDPCQELARTHGDMTKYVLRHNVNVKDAVKFGFEEGKWVWAACLVIRSPIGREHARHVAVSLRDVYNTFVKQKYYLV